MISDKELLKQFKDSYGASRNGCGPQWRHIKECQSFYSGDYMNYKDEVVFGRGSSRRIKEVSFNRVKPYVNSMVGFMAQMRRKPDYQAILPDKEDQVAYTEYLNGFSDYVRENCHASQHETRQDKDMIIGGIGATDTAITLKAGNPTRLPNGEIIEERVDPCEVGWDPAAVYPNLLDSKWVYRVKDYYTEEAEELFGVDEDVFEVAAQDDNNDYHFKPYGGIQDKIAYEYSDHTKTKVRVYFYQWYEVEKFYRVANPLKEITDPALFEAVVRALETIESDADDGVFSFNPGAEMLVITKDKRNDVRKIFDYFDIPFTDIQDKRKVYYTAVISGERVLSKYKSVSQEGFSIKFKTGDYDDVKKIWTGIVSSMREPQRYYNKALTELLLIIASNARGGVAYEESAVDNIAEFEASWAQFNTATRVGDGAISGKKIMPKATPHMNTGYEQIIAMSGENFGLVTGIDESFFGVTGGGNETAMLQRQRIKQVMTAMACYFDSADLYLKEQARLMLSFMRLLAESSSGQMFRIFDPDGNMMFERIDEQFFAEEYQITVGEIPETPVQKEYYTQTLITMAQSMQAIGDPRYTRMYAAAVKYMPIPERDKKNIIEVLIGEKQISEEELKQIVEPLQAQIQQMQGQQAQLGASKMAADIEKVRADTVKAIEDAKKTTADIDKVLEDTEAKAIENDIMAMKDYDDVNVNI